MVCGVGGCVIVGLVNGWMIVKMKIGDMVMRVGMMFMIEGVGERYRKGVRICENMVVGDGSF